MHMENHLKEPRDDRYARAQAKYDFYKHLTVYVVINAMLMVINLVTAPGYFWAIWPLVGWGVAIVLHALSVFVFDRNRIVETLVEREGRHNHAGHD